MTRIKICGLTRAEDVDAAVEAGADFLGFNFWRGSSRRLEPCDAKSLVDRVRRGAIPVGVFVHGQSWDPVVCEYAGVAWAQIHGAPDSWLPERFTRPVIRAVPVAGPVGASALTGGDYWIVDTAQKGHGGGGVTFAWSHAQALTGHPRVFLAGGLTPENVAAAVKQLKPYAVDVASGVETAPGKKDAGKIRAFVEAVRGADKELG